MLASLVSGILPKSRMFLYKAGSMFQLQCNKSGTGDDTESMAHNAGNLPGGGLGKLRHTREEVYFCKQQHELIKKLIEKYQNPDAIKNTSEEEREKEKRLISDYITTCGHNPNGRSVDVREEEYFYNQQIDDLKRLHRVETEKSQDKFPTDLSDH